MNMNTKDALNRLGLTPSATQDEIKAAYRKACATYHPDRNPAGLEMMKLVNMAYAALENYKPSATQGDENIAYGDEMNTALNAIIDLGLTIEICGSWVWVSGDTRPHKDILKSAGFRWAPKKAMWHYRPAEWKSHSRGKYSMDEIREKHGSVSVKPSDRQRIAA